MIALVALAAVVFLLIMTKGSASSSGAGPQPGDTTSLPSDQIKSLLTDAASRYAVDVSLVLAVARAESNFNQEARSRANPPAIGVMQLEPGTASDLSVDPYDVYQNIDGGVRYLAQLLGKYNGDTSLAVAAYNAGPGNVDKYGGIPPFTETQNYVTRVLGYQMEYAA